MCILVWYWLTQADLQEGPLNKSVWCFCYSVVVLHTCGQLWFKQVVEASKRRHRAEMHVHSRCWRLSQRHDK